jgi:protein disulfide-isomerase
VKAFRAILLSFMAIALVGTAAARAETEWLTDYKKAQQQAKETKKRLLLDFTGSDWCPPCIMLHKQVFATREFQDYASKHLVLLEVDFPRTRLQRPELTQQNQELAMRYGVEVFPSILVFDSEGKPIGGFKGYDGGTAKDFIAELEKLGKS